MKNKIIIAIAIVFLLISLIWIPYKTNPLVVKNKINFTGYLHILLSNLTRNGEKLGFMAGYAYNVSENDPQLEEYAIYLFETASRFGDNESDTFLGLYNIFVKNDDQKGIEYINKISENHEGVKNFYLGIYYILKKNDYEKGIELLKPAKENNFYYTREYPLSLNQPIDNENLRKEVENIKNVILEKQDVSNIEFGL